MNRRWIRIYRCGGYCATDMVHKIEDAYSPIEEPKGILKTDKYPTAHGWILTEHPRWSYHGEPVWLCPDCQARWKREQDEYYP